MTDFLEPSQIRPTTRIGSIDWATIVVGVGTVLIEPANIYKCKIGKSCRIGPFVEIQRDVTIGDRVMVCSHSFICAGCIIEDDVFIGHGVQTCNCKEPRASYNGKLIGPGDWECNPVLIRKGASIGTGAILLPGVIVNENVVVGAGAVVTKCIPKNWIVAGNPAKQIGIVNDTKD